MREELSPRKKVCLLWNWGKHSPFRFQLFTAETVPISIIIYLEKIKIIFRIELTFFQNHYTASGSPVDPIFPKFSLFVPFNRVNLWYYAIFLCFYFSTSYFIFELPCIVSFEPQHASDWPLFNKRFTVTVGCTWCFPLSRLCRDSKLAMRSYLNIEYESEE